jgi:hypothetical protein
MRENVGSNIPGLSLSESVLDANVAQNATAAYIEWTLTFKNETLWPQEASGQILIPHAGVASRLTLWVNGQEMDAAFGSRSQTQAAYDDVAVVRREDPALLVTAGPDQLLLRCFPVPAEGTMKVKVGISAPLLIREGKAYLTLPRFIDHNFAIPSGMTHPLWVESYSEVLESPAELVRDTANAPAVSVRGELANDQLHSALGATLAFAAPDTTAATFTATLAEWRGTMRYATPPTAESIVFVVDGSGSMDDSVIDWKVIVEALPKSMAVNAIFAGFEVTQWRDEFAVPTPDLALWLADQRFAGGCDAVPALARAWEMAAARNAVIIVWVHGPQPVTLTSADTLKQWVLRRPTHPDNTPIRLMSLAAVPGTNLVLNTLDAAQAAERVPVLNSLTETFATLAARQHVEDVTRTFTLTSAEEPAPTGSVETTTHVVRLAAADAINHACRNGDATEIEAATKLGVGLRLVTPLSGAVVLETEAQYARHNLDPGNDPEVIPAIPEPEEWALIIVATSVLLFALWHKRRTAMESM